MGLEEYIAKGQDIEVTLWDPEVEDDEGESFSSYIRDFRSGFLYVDMPKFEDPGIYDKIQPGLLVGAVVTAPTKQIIFYPRVYAGPDSDKSVLMLRIASDTSFEVIQRRKHVRVPAEIPVSIEVMDENNQPVASFRSTTINISGGGVRFTTPAPLENGQNLRVTIRLFDLQKKTLNLPQPKLKKGFIDDSGNELKFKAIVAFSGNNKFHKTEQDLFLCGVSFQEVTRYQEMIMVRECIRRELALKRPSQLE